MKGIGIREERLFFLFCVCLFCVDETASYFVSAASATTLIDVTSSASRSATTATATATAAVAVATETKITNSSMIKKVYKFAMVPKNINDSYHEAAYKGCKDKARIISTTTMPENNNNNTESYFDISCVYKGPERDDAKEQAAIIDELITAGDIDGIAVAVSSLSETTQAIDRATAAGIPVITYDSDSPNSTRLAYIGTDNYAFGIELGKVLAQIAPEGATYGIIAHGGPNVQIRADGIIHRLEQSDSKWKHVEGMNSPLDCHGDINLALQLMYELASNTVIDAIITVGKWPMMNESGWKDFVNSNRRLKLIAGDTMPVQKQLMDEGYANGLVGQQPYIMGEKSVETLLQIVQGTFATVGFNNNNDNSDSSIFLLTSLLEYLKVPIVLPELDVDKNYLEKLAILGYIYFSIVALVVLVCGIWLVVNRKERVVYASQPPFLCMVCAGTLVMGSTILPLTIDTHRYSQTGSDVACMAMPWLFSIGFITTFAALFSKLWRVNRLFLNPNSYKRLKVEAKDVIIPYLILLGINLVVLFCWTLISPLKYIRRNNPGRDGWNRIMSTHGVCLAEEEKWTTSIVCTSILTALNLVVLVLANYQAYQVRTVQTEFSESSYIAIIMASMLQAFVLGTPILFLVYRQPEVFFVVASTLIFMTCLSVLLFIFVPKMLFLQSKKKDGDTTVTVNRRERQSQYDVDRHNGMKMSLQTTSDDFQAVLRNRKQTTTCTLCKIKESAELLKSKITVGFDNNSKSKQEDDNSVPDFRI